MNITDIRVRKVNSDSKMKAIISVTFDDAIVIHDIKIIDGKENPFVAMPSRRRPNGEFRDVAHPINSEARRELEDAIFKKYNEVLDEMRLEEEAIHIDETEEEEVEDNEDSELATDEEDVEEDEEEDSYRPTEL